MIDFLSYTYFHGKKKIILWPNCKLGRSQRLYLMSRQNIPGRPSESNKNLGLLKQHLIKTLKTLKKRKGTNTKISYYLNTLLIFNQNLYSLSPYFQKKVTRFEI